MKILGIDYGLKKIGLAFSETSLVEPLLVLKNEPAVIKKIARICRECGVEKIIIGLPKGKLASRAKNFGKKLSHLTRVPFVFQDETLTSQEAIAKMIEAGKKRKARREKEDAIAAAIILQTYLDSHV